MQQSTEKELFTADLELDSALRELARPVVGEAPLSPGTRVGPYIVLDLLGRGGMGLVYRAHDARHGRYVALKVPVGGSAVALSAVLREACTATGIAHPNVAAVLDVGPTYFAMELLPGGTLREKLRAGALPPARALECARQVASALAAVHGARIVHRDLKPENLVFDAGGALKLVDFGLAVGSRAKGSAGDDSVRSILAWSGTRGYMAPEQEAGEGVDARTDIFAFGLVLAEMLGVRPPEALSAGDRLNRLPFSVCAFVRACLSPTLGDRPSDGAALVRRLAGLSRHLALHGDA